MTEASLFILLGIVVLYAGGEALVRGAASLSIGLGLSPVVAGMTVVAFGTSVPELFTSLNAALAGKGNIAVGNSIGSNSFNVGIVLGATALFRPLRARMRVLRFDAPLMVVVATLPLWILWDGVISQTEAIILLGLFVTYIILVVRMAKSASSDAEVTAEFSSHSTRKRIVLLDVVLIAAGIGLLILGSRWLVNGSVAVARHFNVSEALIGLTIVAAGTSMPELAASMVAAYRGKPDVAFANIIGANVFNILAILGACGLTQPVAAPDVVLVDIAVMITLAIALVPMMRSGLTLDRWEGFSLVAAYGVYLWWLWPR